MLASLKFMMVKRVTVVAADCGVSIFGDRYGDGKAGATIAQDFANDIDERYEPIEGASMKLTSITPDLLLNLAIAAKTQ